MTEFCAVYSNVWRALLLLRAWLVRGFRQRSSVHIDVHQMGCSENIYVCAESTLGSPAQPPPGKTRAPGRSRIVNRPREVIHDRPLSDTLKGKRQISTSRWRTVSRPLSVTSWVALMGRPSDWVLMCGASRDSILHWSSTSACLLALSRCGFVAGSVSWLEVPGQTSCRGAHSLAYWMTALESQSRWTIRQSLDRFQGRPGPCTSSISISARRRQFSYRYRTLSIRTRCWCSQGSSCVPLNALNRCASRRCLIERSIRAEQSFLDWQLARVSVNRQPGSIVVGGAWPPRQTPQAAFAPGLTAK